MLPQALKFFPKCNKLPNLVTLLVRDYLLVFSPLDMYCYTAGTILQNFFEVTDAAINLGIILLHDLMPLIAKNLAKLAYFVAQSISPLIEGDERLYWPKW